MNNKAKIQEEARFKILRLLYENPELTQRELGRRVGISLGAVNYCLRALIERGLVKAGNFSRNPNKLGYAYVLTPAGIVEKTSLTGKFLKRKVSEYEALHAEIQLLKDETLSDIVRAVFELSANAGLYQSVAMKAKELALKHSEESHVSALTRVIRGR